MKKRTSPAKKRKSAARPGRKTATRKPRAAKATRRPLPAPPIDSNDLAMLGEAATARNVFWQNVMRQILTSLSVEFLNRSERAGPPPAPGAGPPVPASGAEDLFDGRLGVLTHGGERIPIAQVFPVLPCGVGTTDEMRLLSLAVECSVFQVRTPTGEVFTIPLQEVRGFHALTPELMRALEDAARREAEAESHAPPDGPGVPFGFAAFTSMERAGRERRHGIAYPQHAPDAPNPHPEE